MVTGTLRRGHIHIVLCVLAVFPGGLLLGGCLFDSGDGGNSGSYEINGYVLTQTGGPIQGVEIRAYFDRGDGPSTTPSLVTVTDARGFYRVRFDDSVVWLRVAPGKDLCDFRPPNVSYNTSGRSIPNENFTGYCGSMNRIEGHIRTPTGNPVRGVAVLLREAGNLWNTEVFTGSDGFYLIGSIVPGHTYVVTPSHAGYTFEPNQRTYPDLAQDFAGQDFTANPQP